MGVFIIIISLILFILINIYINLSVFKNQEVVNIFSNIFLKQNLGVYSQYKNDFSRIEINNKDYIGLININNVSLPIEATCANSFINFKSACSYLKEDFVILGTNLKNSFNNYKLYNVNDLLIFYDGLGNSFQYKINSIKRINKLYELSKYDEDLIIVIKNYYNLEYVLLLCELY